MLEQTEVFHQMVAKVFAVQSICHWHRSVISSSYKFTGKLYSEDSERAYEQLQSSLSTLMDSPPCSVWKHGGQVIYIVKEPPKLQDRESGC